ncbi:MAG TPA: DUF484 family protein [Gammaproteobacteria bacterium]|nr:DUF484 family protein [Gammaproteobacteria bacterium]
MSQNEGVRATTDVKGEDEIAAYLAAHPDFFDRHGRLLQQLKIAHHTGGAAVSLVERQVSVLRQRSAELEKQLKQLVAVAKLNDALMEKIHRLALRLMATSDVAERLELLETGLREDFLAERAVLVLFDAQTKTKVSEHAFVKFVDRNDTVMKPFASFLKTARPRCGLIRDRQKSFLFEGHEAEIGSAALVPLGRVADLGFLVIGSSDRDYFNPGKSMDLLGRLGELVAVALTGRLSPAVEISRRESEL